MKNRLDHIRFVLIRPTHPGNIGASARAMKNMGLSRLYLVDPKYFPHDEATARSSGAEDLLQNAIVVKTLDEAINDCQLLIGTSSRTRSLPWPILSARNCAERICSQYDRSTEVAVLFGQERTGLTNDELALCHLHLYIPCNPDFYSLNLAAAVQVVAYELRMHYLQESLPSTINDDNLTNLEQMNLFYAHLEKTLVQIGFMNPEQPKHLMLKLRRLFNRTAIENNELNILRGILSAINNLQK